MKNCMDEQLIKATIVGMKWERVIVHMDVQLTYKDEQVKKLPITYYAVNGLYKARAMFKVSDLGNDKIRLSLNITNPGDCQCLRMGTYSILVCDEERILGRCVVDPSIVPYMED